MVAASDDDTLATDESNRRLLSNVEGGDKTENADKTSGANVVSTSVIEESPADEYYLTRLLVCFLGLQVN